MSSNQTPRKRGVHHVGLTVANLDETKGFFVVALGYSQVGEVADYPAVFLSDGHVMITLWQVVDPDGFHPFDRKHVVGLHHVALAVESDVELKQVR